MYTHFKIPHLQIENYDLDKNIVDLIPEELARCHQLVAIDKLENHGDLKVLTVGMVNPKNETAKAIIGKKLNCQVIPFEIDLDQWADVINHCYLGG